MKKNYILDIVLFISAVVCIVTGVMMDFHIGITGREMKMFITDWHIWSGYIMLLGILIHLFWHWGWIQNVTKLLFGSKVES